VFNYEKVPLTTFKNFNILLS